MDPWKPEILIAGLATVTLSEWLKAQGPDFVLYPRVEAYLCRYFDQRPEDFPHCYCAFTQERAAELADLFMLRIAQAGLKVSRCSCLSTLGFSRQLEQLLAQSWELFCLEQLKVGGEPSSAHKEISRDLALRYLVAAPGELSLLSQAHHNAWRHTKLMQLALEEQINELRDRVFLCTDSAQRQSLLGQLQLLKHKVRKIKDTPLWSFMQGWSVVYPVKA